MKRILVLLLCLLVALPAGLAGCGKKDENTLVVSYYNGGFGKQWLQDAADSFSKEKNIKVRLVAEADYDCGAPIKLKSGKNLPDVYIAASGTWREWVTLDYLEDLTDVYEAYTPVTDSSLEGYSSENGGQIKIKDYLDQRFIDYPYMQKRMGEGEFKPWILQWSVQPCGFVYNTDILHDTVHHNSNGSVDGIADGAKWNRFPETVSELITYFDDIKTNNAAKTYGEKQIIPLGWSGQEANSLFPMMYTWWAQSQGTETPKIDGEGTFFDFYNYGNTVNISEGNHTFSSSVFMQSGLKKAYETLRSLIVGGNGEFKNSDPKVQSMSPSNAQAAFFTGNYAVMNASSWLEYESREFLDTDKDGKNDINFEYYPIVSLDDYDGNQLTYCKIGDFMFIPKKATNKELAKEFLVHLASEQNNMNFSKITGSVKPFQYNPLEMAPDHNWTNYTKSVFDTFYDETTEYLYDYPKNTEKDCVSVVYRYHAYTFIAETEIATWLTKLKSNKTVDELMEEIRESAYDSVEQIKNNLRIDLID